MQPKPPLVEPPEDLVDRVLTCATEVHRELGPGLLESVYEAALMIEFSDAGVSAEQQVALPVAYKGHELGLGFRADIIVEGCLLLEVKAVKELTDSHLGQTMNYLKLLGFRRGYLLNFHVPLMKKGIKRVTIWD